MMSGPIVSRAGPGSMCTSSPTGASRQSIMSYQKRLSGGRRSVQALGPTLGATMGPTLGAGGLRSRGGLARRHAPRLLLDGADVTPKPLHDVGFAADDRPPVTNAWELLAGLSPVGAPLGAMGPLGPNVHSAPSSTSGIIVTRESSFGGSFMAGWGGLQHTSVPASSVLSVFSDDPAPSQFALPRPVSLKAPPLSPLDTPLEILLSETQTFTLLDLASSSASADSDEGAAILLDNERAEELASDGSSRQGLHHVEVQTTAIWVRSRGTNLARVRRKNAGVQASLWDIFDTEHGVPTAPLATQPTQQTQQADRRTMQRRRRVLRRAVLDRISSQRSLSLSDADTKSIDSKDVPRAAPVLNLPSFRRAVLQMERVMSAYEYSEQQVLYRGIPAADPLSADLRFEYRLLTLWHLECEWAAGRSVTSMVWNPDNPDLLAVGYGKYLQQDQATGLICMWSSKNPVLPERLYRFSSPVTTVCFSPTRPNLLAVAMANGGLALLDVSSLERSVVADAGDGSESGVASPSWQPIWTMVWVSGHEFQLDDQVLITAGQDGRVVRWRRGERGLESTPMLRVPVAEGGEKGVAPLLAASGTCPEKDVGLRQHSAVLCMEPVPYDPVRYLVATEDGCVHTCSTNYLHHHASVVVAHAGPVYRLSFSPFCEKIFLTCGADWTVRLWAMGINEPLVTLAGGMQTVEDAAWSPRNSTVLASLSGDEVSIWDLRRKTYVPASRTPWTYSSTPTTLLFSTDQDNLLVGDRDGRVVAFSLQDMPFAPYFQTKALVASLERALATKPGTLAALRKLGEPFA